MTSRISLFLLVSCLALACDGVIVTMEMPPEGLGDAGVGALEDGSTPRPIDDAGTIVEGGDDAGVGESDGGGAPTEPIPDGSTPGGEPPPQVLPEEAGVIVSSDDPCLTRTPTIVGTDGADTLIGTDGPDVIFGGAGDDVIWGNAGDDVICAGGGADRIEGGAGNDYIDAGFGRDVLNGGAGNDVLHGRSGGDQLRGGPGWDTLFGGLLDDDLFGDDGNDLLIGGHGIDRMHGGEGDDWLRGDTNRDEFIGGVGHDTVSFMTATPPGQPLDAFPARSGVVVDNRVSLAGWASGDGYRESLAGVDVVVGSAFDDTLRGGVGLEGSYGDDQLEGAPALHGGPGDDTCAGAPCADGEGAPPADRALVFLAAHPRDVGLAVVGSAGADAIGIALEGGVAVVRSENGAPLTAGHGCRAVDATVRCVLPGELRYIVGYGGDGNDRIALSGAFPRDMTATLDGGAGDDVLIGHDGEDILFAGASGHDTLEGLGGDDALLSESGDADTMRAGGGNDQLVANTPCAGHLFEGGGGIDVGGFARVGTSFDTAAERHRQRIHAQIGFRAYQPAFCAHEAGTRLADDIEILEGAGGDDELIGNGGDNTIWGWGGDDVIRGLGGNDTIEGHLGNDTIYGGAGRDRLRGGSGYDVLHASDGERDVELSCGGDRGRVASRDPDDPGAEACD